MKPIILVVDDSDIQRQLIGGLLKHASDYDIRFAWDGQDACEYLDKSTADVVLTDLFMPGIDGLALIELLRARHADIPVTLVTAHGNEEIAADALRRGAVNYVPKAELSERLVPTVRQMLHHVLFDQRKSNIAKRLDGFQLCETIASDPGLVEPVVDRVHEELIAGGIGDRTHRVGTCIALAEALSNAILHGNLELTREDVAAAKTNDAAHGLERIVQQRLADPRLAARRVSLKANVSAEGTTFTIRDESSRPTAEQDIAVHIDDFLERGHARGLILMKSLMSEVSFNPATNEVIMVAKQS